MNKYFMANPIIQKITIVKINISEIILVKRKLPKNL